IDGFAPTSGRAGDPVTISGSHLGGVTGVAFGDVATTFTVRSDTELGTVVPPGARTARIAITTAAGRGASASRFVVVADDAAPRIGGFRPRSGPIGAEVKIAGSGFLDVTEVRFHGVAATFTVGSNRSLTAIVPASATTGSVSVTTPRGTATS